MFGLFENNRDISIMIDKLKTDMTFNRLQEFEYDYKKDSDILIINFKDHYNRVQEHSIHYNTITKAFKIESGMQGQIRIKYNSSTYKKIQKALDIAYENITERESFIKKIREERAKMGEMIRRQNSQPSTRISKDSSIVHDFIMSIAADCSDSRDDSSSSNHSAARDSD